MLSVFVVHFSICSFKIVKIHILNLRIFNSIHVLKIVNALEVWALLWVLVCLLTLCTATLFLLNGLPCNCTGTAYFT